MATQPVVFVVDDDAAVRDSTAALLLTNGFETLLFSSAEEFLETHNASQAGVLLLDVRLPGMSGLELLSQLPLTNIRLPVIVISGHASAIEEAQKLNHPLQAIYSKPIASDDLLEQINLGFEKINAE